METNDTTTIAAITIGQSPRTDVTADLTDRLAPNLRLVEYGALDDYTSERIAQELAPTGNDEILVSRMRDGSSVTFSGRLINPLVQQKITQAEQDGAACLVLLCTGEFPAFDHTVPLIEPLPLYHAAVRVLAGSRTIGLIVPEVSQIGQASARWEEDGVHVHTVSASPYGDAACIAEAARSLRGGDYPFICLDCIGFTRQMRSVVQHGSGLPVLLPRTFVAAVVSELYGR